jgi:hypothetical protein
MGKNYYFSDQHKAFREKSLDPPGQSDVAVNCDKRQYR